MNNFDYDEFITKASKEGLPSTREDMVSSNIGSPFALLQWVIRYCQSPEIFHNFIAWSKSFWPEMTFSDKEIMEDLITLHDMIGRMERSILN